jgi:dTDP-4-amino-4,6-dideoxygalactose transaminase
VVAPGINGKMSEFNAALGLLQLKHMDRAIARRKLLNAAYCEQLAEIRGIRCLNTVRGNGANYAYFPILVGVDYLLSRDALCQKLRDHGIHPRRYFHPLISDFPMYRGLPSAGAANLPVAAAAARQILCLPIYPDLEPAMVADICRLIATP